MKDGKIRESFELQDMLRGDWDLGNEDYEKAKGFLLPLASSSKFSNDYKKDFKNHMCNANRNYGIAEKNI